MEYQDNISSEDAYNSKLVGKLSGYRTVATEKNAGKQISKKLLHSQAEARRTQRMLVGESTVYKPAVTHEATAEVAVQPTYSAAADKALLDSQLDYINLLTEHEPDDFDMEASFADVEQQMRDNNDDEANNENDEQA